MISESAPVMATRLESRVMSLEQMLPRQVAKTGEAQAMGARMLRKDNIPFRRWCGDDDCGEVRTRWDRGVE